MAKAYRCDICNRFYMHTNNQIFSVIGPERRLDICNDCYVKLVKLINEEEEQKNAGTN